MTDPYQAIRDALALGPTPGPWVARGNEVWAARPMRFNSTTAGTPRIAVFDNHETNEQPFPCETNAALAAACAPETIRALLEERDALAAKLAALEENSGWLP